MADRWPWRFGSLLVVAAVLSLGAGSPADAAAAGGLQVAVRSADPAAVSVTLTNRSDQPCQVVDDALGTVAFTAVTQGGRAVAPTADFPNFTDDLGPSLTASLRTLAPGASITLPVETVATGPTGHALETVSWAPLAIVGALFPVAAGTPLAIQATYHSPVNIVSGPPLCAPAAGASGVAASPAAWRWLWVGLAAVGVVVIVGLVLLLARRRRSTVVAVLLAVAGGLLVVTAHPPAARAIVSTPDPALTGELANCLALFSAPGNDPSSIMEYLNGGVRTQVTYEPNYMNERELPGNPKLILWTPDDTHPYKGGTLPDMCDELYHELYHAWRDDHGGNDRHECVTKDGGYTGISIAEVDATRNENLLRAARAQDPRNFYGDHALPAEPCLPNHDPNDICTDQGCPKHPTPSPTAHTTSDPHLRTFDGRSYDFQGAGEFVAFADTSATGPNAMQLQVRQRPWPGSRFVATNTAAVADVEGDRVEVRADGQSGMTMLLNGVPTAMASGPLPHGGRLDYQPQGSPPWLVAYWPDGSYVEFTTWGTFSLTVLAYAAPDRAGKLSGLLGNNNGSNADDIPATTYDALYPHYADRMRVTPATSLFTYAPGTSTATYTIEGFPARPPAVTANASWAKAVCTAYGVTDPGDLAACIEDVAYTGSAEFLAADVAVAGSAAPPAATPTPSASAPGTPTAAQTTTVDSRPGAPSTVPFDGTAGQKVYIAISSTLPDSCAELVLRDPSGQQIGASCIINGGGLIDTVTLPDTGTYTIVITPVGTATGHTTLRWYYPVDRHTTISIDGAATSLAVDIPGSVGTLTFTGTAGQIVFADVPSSTLPDMCGVLWLIGPSGSPLSSGCVINGAGLIDRTVLPATGSYTLRLDPAGPVIGSVQVRLTSATDQTATITAGGPAVTAVISQPGAMSRFTFTATAGQAFTLDAIGSTFGDQCGTFTIVDAAGRFVAGACVIGGHGSMTTPKLAAGAYTVVVDPPNTTTGQATLRLHI